ncbi:MAG: hypothetical protein DMG39_17870 [Acidobacteria bacterium]|nr:MAG: hypothetical protein DMG39_17870 [Acidobacteriota bacterium]
MIRRFSIKQGTIADSPPGLTRQGVALTLSVSNLLGFRGIQESIVAVAYPRPILPLPALDGFFVALDGASFRIAFAF